MKLRRRWGTHFCRDWKLSYAAFTSLAELTRNRFIEIDSVRSIFFRSPRSAGPAKVEATPCADARPGAAYAMDKVLGHLGHVEVDYVRHVGHIDAASGNVGGHQHAVTPLGEAAQGLVALGLRAVAVNLRRRVAGARQPARHAICAVLGAHENQKAALSPRPAGVRAAPVFCLAQLQRCAARHFPQA